MDPISPASSTIREVLGALGLDPTTTTTVSSCRSRGVDVQKFDLSFVVNGKQKHFCLKISTNLSSKLALLGEHESLKAIQRVLPNLCPASYALGVCPDEVATHFLITDPIHLRENQPWGWVYPGSGKALAQKLARLHTTPAPIPEGYDRPMYGFPVATRYLDSPQDNSWKESWADFFAENRLRAVLELGIRNWGHDREMEDAVQVIIDRIVPRLLGDGHLKGIRPVLVHGGVEDMNQVRGIVDGQGGEEEVVVIVNPCSFYAHSEYEFGYMWAMNRFPDGFWSEYGSLVPQTQPDSEFLDRLSRCALIQISHLSLMGSI